MLIFLHQIINYSYVLDHQIILLVIRIHDISAFTY